MYSVSLQDTNDSRGAVCYGFCVSVGDTNDSRGGCLLCIPCLCRTPMIAGGLFVMYSVSLQDTNDSRGAVCYVFCVSAGHQ